MDIRVVKKEDEKLLLEIPGETFTLTNTLREELWNDSNVSEAAEIKEHPYLAEPKIWVVVKRGSPVTALEKACERIEKKAEEFRKKFKDALKG